MEKEAGAAHAHTKKGHDAHKGHHTEDFLRKFVICLVLTVPILLYADIFKTVTGWAPPPFPGTTYASLVLGSIIFFYGGFVFLKGAFREIRARLPGMMTLISIAVLAAYLWSVYAVFAGEETLFWELSTLITIMLLGHWLEMRAVSGAEGALKELSKLLPDTVEIIRNGMPATAPLSDLRENDLILIRPGAKVPADGTIVDGGSDLNESMITGESRLVAKGAGDTVIAGTINGDGVLTVRVAHIGEGTFLAGVMRLVAEAQASKSRLQVLSDRAALYLTVIAVGGGGITLSAWLFAGAETGFAVARLVAVLVVACPHALGLAVPLIASISTTKAARNGFLIKRRIALEAARVVDTVLFDKTGTLTKGAFGVTSVRAVSGVREDEVVRTAASLDSVSEHPISTAIVEEAHKRGLTLSAPVGFEALKGRGARARIDGREIAVGGAALLEDRGIPVPAELHETLEKAGERGETVIFVLQEDTTLGALALADVIREESKEAIQLLKNMGIASAMITGDSPDVAKWVSREVGVDEYFARVLPGQKSEKVKELKERGRTVAMVGDGINDAPALAEADLGIAIGAGTNVAIESAGIILVRNDPRDIAKIITLSRLTYRKMMQNLFWATGYNVVALPLAAGALAFRGILLEPALAAVFMSASTIIVAANALLLRRHRL